MPKAAMLLLMGVAILLSNQVEATPQLGEHTAEICGRCPEGKTREASFGIYCGRCVQINQSCAQGFYWDDKNSKCEGCPCRTRESPCMKDSDGLITCKCPVGYEGRVCERCSSGYVQEGQYPYRCLQLEGRPSNQPLPELPTGCPEPAQQNQGRSPRQAPYGSNTNPLCPAVLQSPPVNPTALQQYNPAQAQCPPAPVCPPVPGCPPLPNPYPSPICPVCPGPSPCPPPGPGPSPCPAPAPGPSPCPPPGPGPSPCPAPAPGPSPCPPPGPGPSPCPAPVPCPPPGPGPAPPSDCVVRACPTVPACPPVPGCPPGVPCPAVPACPPYPACPPVPGCPPNVPCPSVPACPQYPPCPVIPPWPQIPPCPQLPPIPACPACPPPTSCGQTPCPATQVYCNLTCPETKCCGGGADLLIPQQPCICDPRGTVRQDGFECICKTNVEGASCNTCKRGYFGLRHGNPDGCSKCFCSGVTDECRSAIMFREMRAISMNLVTLVDKNGNVQEVRYVGRSTEFVFPSRTNGEFYWVLPISEVDGNRVSSYGSKIEATRHYSTGLMTPSVPGNDVIIEGTNGVSLFWSAMEPCAADKDLELVVRIHESEHWMVWRNGRASIATRGDIMSVLASVDRILLRASFTPERMAKSSIKNIRFGTAVGRYTTEGFTLHAEECQCPTGYQGLSCENCSPGFYRDFNDMTRSVFGSCKMCPCRKNSIGCKLEFGSVVCVCEKGYTGPRCEDSDYVSVTLDPSRVRDCVGESITFNCTYASSSAVRIEFETIPPSFTKIETNRFSNGITTTMQIGRSIDRVICKILDEDPRNSYIIAQVYSRIDAQVCAPPIRPPIGPLIRVEAGPKFICIREREGSVKFECSAWSFASRKLTPRWSRAGTKSMPRSADISGDGVLIIRNPVVEDTGTYYCSGDDSSIVQLDSVVLVVQKNSTIAVIYPFEEQDDAPAEGQLMEDTSDSRVELTATTVFPTVGTNTSSEITSTLIVSVLPPELSVPIGHSAEFKCNVAGETEDLQMYWRKRNGTIKSDVRTNTSLLQFNSVRKVHEGEYHCVANNKAGKSSGRAVLRVLEKVIEAEAPPSPIEKEIDLVVSLSPAMHALRPGDKAVLTCEGNQNDLKIIWSKENGTIRSSKAKAPTGRNLVFQSVIPADSGWYICSANSPSTKLSGTGRVELVVKPEEIAPTMVISEPSPQAVRVGQRINLECQTYGEPMPNVTWSRFIETADGYQEQILLQAVTTNLIYEIRRVVKEHEGDYFCTGRNEAGQDRVSIRLEVEEGITCASDEFQCHSLDQCVKLEDRCDKENDCRDGSDERHCHRRTRRSFPLF